MEFLGDVKETILWVINTGTNTAIWNFVTNNALLLGAVAAITPWTWDNRFIDYIRGKKND